MQDLHRLDRDLDHLRSVELMNTGFYLNKIHEVEITPTALGMHLYVRCQGYIGSPVEYWQLTLKPTEDKLVKAFDEALGQ